MLLSDITLPTMDYISNFFRPAFSFVAGHTQSLFRSSNPTPQPSVATSLSEWLFSHDLVDHVDKITMDKFKIVCGKLDLTTVSKYFEPISIKLLDELATQA